VGGRGRGWGQGGEMTQALYAHMNNKTIKIKRKDPYICLWIGSIDRGNEE
jgi:hypothetical protein